MGTYTLYGAKSGGYRYNDPNTHYSGTTIGTGFNEQMAVSFAQLPTEIKYKKICIIHFSNVILIFTEHIV